MPPYGEPDWASPGDTSNVATTQAGLPSAPASSGGGATTNTNSADVRYVCVCVCVCATSSEYRSFYVWCYRLAP